ncbi:methylmalonyl-CoA mutase small subunit [alpha proteobacterium Q-1]|nr:methylmalonyl-CoA mutase small subunit [alpha proteobacterium Q-1]
MPYGEKDAFVAFDRVGYQDWKALIEQGLDARSFSKVMESTSPDGFVIAPLYCRDHPKPDLDPAHLYAPIRCRLGDARGWQIRQRIDHPDPVRANAQLLKDLERGATHCLLSLDPMAEKGVAVGDLDDLDRLLLDVDLNLAPVYLDAGRFGPAAAALLLALWDRRGLTGAHMAGGFGIDPLGALAEGGSLLSSLPDAMKEAGAIAAQCHDRTPHIRALSVSSRAYHGAGASPAQELAIALACGLSYLRCAEKAGLSLVDAARQISFSLMADCDVTLTIAKFRAMRLLWSQLLAACGVDEQAIDLAAETAPRMISRYDPMVNVLRATIACFSAAIGGAGAITVLPHSAAHRHASGVPDDFSRRIARNVQIILAEESHLDKVIDPAGGSFTIEAQTHDLAQAASQIFRKIEQQGGMEKALCSGMIAQLLDESWSALAKNLASRKQPITGVSEFPNLDEPPVPLDPVDQEALASQMGGQTGGQMGGLSARDDAARLDPLPFRPLAQDYEHLRARADAKAAAKAADSGGRPRIYLAALGALADHGARLNWVRNAFATGGIAAIAGAGGMEPEAIAQAFAGSDAPEAVICGTDAHYAEHGAALARALKKAGAGFVYLAGRAGSDEAELRAAGVDAFIHQGIDLVKLLGAAHDRWDQKDQKDQDEGDRS